MEPWTKFRNLCHYYADCVKYSEKSQEYLFPNQLNKTFIIPRLPVNWYLKDEEFVVETAKEDAFVRAQLLKDSDEDELFIGYPLNSFISPDGFECLCPVMMFPVSIAVRGAGYTTGMRMRIDREGISINQDWIEYHIPKSEQKAFQRACEQSEDERGCLDVEMVLNYLSAHFPSIRLDPNQMQFAVRNSESKKSILNTAVLFEGTKTKYTKTLLSELHRISKEPDAILDQTALAYVFRDPPLPNDCDDGQKWRVPVSFTKRPLNNGQFASVEESLNKPIVKVMGPPGTGKSFMAVNLIANEVLAGGSVLFTSKNHKAIHAIFDKAPAAIENRDFPLVSFCTTPDNPQNADWQKSQKDLEARIDKTMAAIKGGFIVEGMDVPKSVRYPALSALNIALARYHDAEKHIARYQNLREKISQYERFMLEIDEMLQALPKISRDTPEFLHLLEECDALLSHIPPQTWRARIVALAMRLLGRRRSCEADILGQLALIAPKLANAIVTKKTMAADVRRLLETLHYRTALKEWEHSEMEVLRVEESQYNFDELKRIVADSLADASGNAQKAYVEGMIKRISSLKDTDSLLDRCKALAGKIKEMSALEFMAGIADDGKYDEALQSFRQYLSVFPAWAATMLSLRRASPCIPGVFSLAIIDEASQCEIPPMIPVLYRAKRAAIIGDPNQFPPVITLKTAKDGLFRRKYHVDGYEYNKFAYGANNVFSVVPGRPLLLNEHFRCADGIAEYFNEEFYDGNLALCCDVGRSGGSAVGAIKPGMMWIDAPGGDGAEIESALEYLRTLRDCEFKGSIGVISPLRDLANRFKTAVSEHRESVPSQLDVQSQITTANGFQGGECDVILFLLGLNADRTHGQDWYITASENKYIYNVSVSRAKHLFVAFGDRKRVNACGLSYIQRLIPESRPLRKVSVGPGEIKLQEALRRVGIETVPQHAVMNRYLDLAIPSLKIDIEVDGQAWHLDCHGCRKADDVHRDIQLEAAGWKVVRVWQHEVVNNIAGCVEKIKDVIRSRSRIGGERG